MTDHPYHLDQNDKLQIHPDDTFESQLNTADMMDEVIPTPFGRRIRAHYESANEIRSVSDPVRCRCTRNAIQSCPTLVLRPITEKQLSDTSISANESAIPRQRQYERQFVSSECSINTAEQLSNSKSHKDAQYYSNKPMPVSLQWASHHRQWPLLSREAVSRLPTYDGRVSNSATPACAASDSCRTEMDYAKPDWSLLPCLAVANILAHLRLRDRYMAALTCKAWLAALCYPEVWHWCELHVQRGTPDHWLTLAQKVGRHVRQLTLYVTQYCGGRHGWAAGVRSCHTRGSWCAQLQSRAAAQALGALRSGGVCKVLHLRVCGLRRFSEWRDGRATGRIICALARFLHGQTQLQMLQLRDAALASENAMWLVRAAAYNCSETLSDVHLDGALGAELDTVSLMLLPYPLPHMTLCPLRALTQLSLSPCQLSDYLLEALPPQLQQLVLVARREDPPDPCLVSDAAWVRVARRLPMLYLELILVGVVTVCGLGSLLPEDGAPAPVVALRLRGRPPGAASGAATLLASELAAGLRLAAVCFCETLCELEVRAAWLRGGPPMDNFLLEMAAALPCLRYLGFHGPVRRPVEIAAKSGVEKVWLRKEKWAWPRC